MREIAMAKTATVEKTIDRKGKPRIVDVIGYAASVGVKAKDTQELIERVERGLAYGAFKRLVELLEVSNSTLTDLLQIPRRTLTRRRQAGRLAPDESERLLRISRVLDAAVELFEGDRGRALRWLQSPNRALNGEAPLHMARTEIGAHEVEDLIGRLEYGVFS
jgi:putative toxin-antitoxin system antitoxin component (TIGR02293 family)